MNLLTREADRTSMTSWLSSCLGHCLSSHIIRLVILFTIQSNKISILIECIDFPSVCNKTTHTVTSRRHEQGSPSYAHSVAHASFCYLASSVSHLDHWGGACSYSIPFPHRSLTWGTGFGHTAISILWSHMSVSLSVCPVGPQGSVSWVTGLGQMAIPILWPQGPVSLDTGSRHMAIPIMWPQGSVCWVMGAGHAAISSLWPQGSVSWGTASRGGAHWEGVCPGADGWGT